MRLSNEDDLPLMPLNAQIETTQWYLDKYRTEQNPIDSNVTLWFESVLESLHRLKSLER